MKNILLTWSNSWIWLNIKLNLSKYYNIYKISKKHVIEDNFYNCDLSNLSNIYDIDFWDTFFDVLIFNAWLSYYWDFFSLNQKNIIEMINVNLVSNILLLNNLSKNINKKTKIIFIWSIISKKFFKNASVYAATKFWIRWLAGSLKKDWYKTFLINPKIVDTDFHKSKVYIDPNLPKTNINDIMSSINLIINWTENRFEIDL